MGVSELGSGVFRVSGFGSRMYDSGYKLWPRAEGFVGFRDCPKTLGP